MIDTAMSVAPDAVSFKLSVVSITILLPESISNDEPAGIGALVTNSTSALFPLLVPEGGLLDVSELSVTVDAVANAITDDDELLVQSPITLNLSFDLA